MDRAQDAHVGAATAQMRPELGPDLGIVRL